MAFGYKIIFYIIVVCSAFRVRLLGDSHKLFSTCFIYQNKAILQSHVFLIKSPIVIKLAIFYCPLFHAFLCQQPGVVIEYR